LRTPTSVRSIELAALDDPAPFAPVAHIWTESMIEWSSADDGLPRFPKSAETTGLERATSGIREAARER